MCICMCGVCSWLLYIACLNKEINWAVEIIQYPYQCTAVALSWECFIITYDTPPPIVDLLNISDWFCSVGKYRLLSCVRLPPIKALDGIPDLLILGFSSAVSKSYLMLLLDLFGLCTAMCYVLWCVLCTCYTMPLVSHHSWEHVLVHLTPYVVSC